MFLSREEYLSRLGQVLQLARKAAGQTQEDTAAWMGMNTASSTRWEDGRNAIGAYDLARLVFRYDFDPDLAVNPPASKVEIRKRLGPVADAARRSVRRGQLRALPDEQPEGGGERG